MVPAVKTERNEISTFTAQCGLGEILFGRQREEQSVWDGLNCRRKTRKSGTNLNPLIIAQPSGAISSADILMYTPPSVYCTIDTTTYMHTHTRQALCGHICIVLGFVGLSLTIRLQRNFVVEEHSIESEPQAGTIRQDE